MSAPLSDDDRAEARARWGAAMAKIAAAAAQMRKAFPIRVERLERETGQRWCPAGDHELDALYQRPCPRCGATL